MFRGWGWVSSHSERRYRSWGEGALDFPGEKVLIVLVVMSWNIPEELCRDA